MAVDATGLMRIEISGRFPDDDDLGYMKAFLNHKLVWNEGRNFAGLWVMEVPFAVEEL